MKQPVFLLAAAGLLTLAAGLRAERPRGFPVQSVTPGTGSPPAGSLQLPGGPNRSGAPDQVGPPPGGDNPPAGALQLPGGPNRSGIPSQVSPPPGGDGMPSPGVNPGNERPGGSPGGAGVGIPADTPGNWGCVREMKPTTKVVYNSLCRKWCTPGCLSLRDLIRGTFGHCDVEPPCNLRTRNILVKKSARDCDRPACVLKEGACAVCQPGHGVLPPAVYPLPSFSDGAMPRTMLPGTVLPAPTLPAPRK